MYYVICLSSQKKEYSFHQESSQAIRLQSMNSADRGIDPVHHMSATSQDGPHDTVGSQTGDATAVLASNRDLRHKKKAKNVWRRN